VVDRIEPLAKEGILLPKTVDEIFESFENWRIFTTPEGDIKGFFEIREFDENTLEMGAVYSTQKGFGRRLIQTFEGERKRRNVLNAFAVTKSKSVAQKFFVSNTGGCISEFFEGFDREKTGRYCIRWE